MKSTELRIGNIIKIKNPILKDLIDEGFQKIYTDRTTVIYVGYDYLGVIIDNSEVEIMLQDVEPIPLTEEWLFKFGFYTDNDSWYYSLDFDKNQETFKICPIYSNGIPSGMFSVLNCMACVKKIQFVHQLQNLYFALTGEELTLKQK